MVIADRMALHRRGQVDYGAGDQLGGRIPAKLGPPTTTLSGLRRSTIRPADRLTLLNELLEVFAGG